MIRTSGQIFMPEKSTENNGKPQIRYYDTEKFANLALDEKTGASIALSIDTNTYIMTVALKNADGTVISSGQIDFPIESVVVNATYKDGILTLVLQNGNSVNVDISDIISGLVSDVQVNGVSVVSNGVANITKESLGLGNVNNTADVNKVVHGATVLTNQDLNNYKTAALVGWYYAAEGNTVKNKPSGVREFGLEIIRAANGVFVQRLTYGNNLYQRTYGGSSWNSWIQYANTTGTYSNMTVGKATNATNAINATNATNDSNGDKIVDTYAKIIQVANPNLLINPDFSINQRGLKNYTTNNTYTVDRWSLVYGRLTVNEDGTVSHTSTNTWQGLKQIIEQPAKLSGKTVTFSAKGFCANGSINISIKALYAGASTTTGIVSKTIDTPSASVITATVTLPTLTNDDKLYVLLYQPAANKTTIWYWAKLEIGSVATEFIPPLIAEELPKCQRYGLLLASGPVRYPNTQILDSTIDFTIPTPSSLRTPPTPSSTANIVVYNPDSSMAVQSGFTFEIVHTTSNAICIRASKSAHGLTRAVLGFTANVFLDAEL